MRATFERQIFPVNGILWIRMVAVCIVLYSLYTLVPRSKIPYSWNFFPKYRPVFSLRFDKSSVRNGRCVRSGRLKYIFKISGLCNCLFIETCPVFDHQNKVANWFISKITIGSPSYNVSNYKKIYFVFILSTTRIKKCFILNTVVVLIFILCHSHKQTFPKSWISFRLIHTWPETV